MATRPIGELFLVARKKRKLKSIRLNSNERGCITTIGCSVLAFLVFLVLYAGASQGSDDPVAVINDNDTQFNEQWVRESGGDPAYKVVSVVKPKKRGDKCVSVKVEINANKLSLSGSDAPSIDMFDLTNSAGETYFYDATASIGDYLPGGHAKSGELKFCLDALDGGDRVVLEHGKRSWKFALPKDEKKVEVEPPEDDSGPGDSDGDGADPGGGGSVNPPGYRGPRCWLPGGRSWRPC